MIGAWELLLLLLFVLFLFFFAPVKLPEMARGLGRAWGEFRLAQKESERELAHLEQGFPDARRDTTEVGKSL